MPNPGPVGELVQLLKAGTGLTWNQLADALGASSGDYLRKVASGAKPGANLAPNVDTFQRMGRVIQPVPRRQAAGGGLARVRAPNLTGAAGRLSRVPEQQQAPRIVRGRFGTATTYTRGGAGRVVHVEAPKTEGVGRERARQAITDAVRQAGKDGRRVRFVLHRTTGDRTTVGARGGYDPATFLRRAAGEGDDPMAVLYDDGSGGSGDTEAEIDGVDVEVY